MGVLLLALKVLGWVLLALLRCWSWRFCCP